MMGLKPGLGSIALMLILLSAAGEGEAAERAIKGEEPFIRVLLQETGTTLSLQAAGPWRVALASGRELGRLQEGSKVEFGWSAEGMDAIISSDSASELRLVKVDEEVLFEPLDRATTLALAAISDSRSEEPRSYAGKLHVYAGPEKKVEAVLKLPLEEYLRGVVPSEIGVRAPAEAQRAQAVAARSAAVLALTTGMYSGERYDICSTVQCQVFSGQDRVSSATDDAVRATRGLILEFEGKPLAAYYSAQCGGHTEAIEAVWSHRAKDRGYHGIARADSAVSIPLDLRTDAGLREWLGQNPPSYCNPSRMEIPEWAGKNYRWTREFSAAELSALAGPEVGAVRELKPLKRGVSGRVLDFEIRGENGTKRLSDQLEIRRWFKPALRSSAFVVDTRGASETPSAFILTGTGSGHGVGMCQTGAMGMAASGKDFRSILAHYYPKARIEKLY